MTAARTLTGDPCPGACNRDWRKLDQAEQETTTRTPGNPVWCSHCTRGIRHALTHIVDAYAQLELDKLHGTATGDVNLGNHVRQPAPPSPSAAADEQDRLVRRLVWWEDQIREARALAARPTRLPVTPSRPLNWCPWPRPLPRPKPDRSQRLVHATVESVTLAGTVRFLLAHLDWALAQPDAGQMLGRDLLRLRARASARTATAPLQERRDVPCPRCELRTLVHVDGAAHVECENPECGRLLTLDEYDKLAAAVARSEGGRVSA